MKYVIFIALIISSIGCSRKVESLDYPLPPELSNCKVYGLSNEHGGAMKVVYCPNATTTTSYSTGKTTSTVVVIDGKEYVEKKR